MSESTSTGDEVVQRILSDMDADDKLEAHSGDWYTEEQLIDLGYRREAITELFGQASVGPDGVVGWTAASVAKIEQSQLAPAFDLLDMAFDDAKYSDAADTMRARVSFDRLWSPGS